MSPIVRMIWLMTFALLAGCSGSDRGSRPPGQGPTDTGTIDAGFIDAGALDSGTVDAGPRDSGPVDSGGPASQASLRITEINPAGRGDLIELVVVTSGILDGIIIEELTNSNFDFTFSAGYSVSVGDVITLHLGGSCTDDSNDKTTCGDTTPFTHAAWDFSMPGDFSYSGKVLEIRAANGSAMDGVPFVESGGAVPDSFVGAVQRLQAAGLWDASACVHDLTTGFARDRYCRNISVIWDDLRNDYSNSVMRIVGDSPTSVPGRASQWSAQLPSNWGTYPRPL